MVCFFFGIDLIENFKLIINVIYFYVDCDVFNENGFGVVLFNVLNVLFI